MKPVTSPRLSRPMLPPSLMPLSLVTLMTRKRHPAVLKSQILTPVAPGLSEQASSALPFWLLHQWVS